MAAPGRDKDYVSSLLDVKLRSSRFSRLPARTPQPDLLPASKAGCNARLSWVPCPGPLTRSHPEHLMSGRSILTSSCPSSRNR